MNKYSTFNPISKNPYRTHKHGQHIKLLGSEKQISLQKKSHKELNCDIDKKINGWHITENIFLQISDKSHPKNYKNKGRLLDFQVNE